MTLVCTSEVPRMINWGNVGAWSGAILSLISAIGYAFAKDYRRALYFLFAFAITVVVIWPGR